MRRKPKFHLPPHLKGRFVDTMSPQETDELILRFQQKKDRKAAQLVMEGHAKLVIWHCRRLWTRYKILRTKFSVEELINESFCSLHRAITKYETGRGSKFSSYAIWHLRYATLRRLLRYELLLAYPEGEKYMEVRRRKRVDLISPEILEKLIEFIQLNDPTQEDPTEKQLVRKSVKEIVNNLDWPLKDKLVFLLGMPDRESGQDGHSRRCAELLYELGLTDRIVTRQRISQIWHKCAEKIRESGELDGLYA